MFIQIFYSVFVLITYLEQPSSTSRIGGTILPSDDSPIEQCIYSVRDGIFTYFTI